MTPFFRFRIELTLTRATKVPPQQGAMLYALLCEAHQPESRRMGANQSFPHGLMTDAPEQCRTMLETGSSFAFGGTLLSADPDESVKLLKLLATRLGELGQQGRPRTKGLGGNFRLGEIRDLATDEPWTGQPLTPLPLEHLDGELQQVLDTDELTIDLLTPVRIERPRKQRTRYQTYLDEQFFDFPMVLRLLLRRMRTIGIQLKGDVAAPRIDTETAQLLRRQIQWLDMAYGGAGGKSLGGIVGQLHLQVTCPILKAALVWGQYARLGKNTSFGFGRYRIRELGPEPFVCRRAVALLETAWNHPAANRLVGKAQLEPGVLGHAIQQVRSGEYQPHPVAKVVIGEGEKQRALQIPSRRDRVLQRLVLEAIGPGVDGLFESSSFAWRRGLGRHHSAKTISRLWRQGYRYAINADFDRFFDSIDHDLLRQRLFHYTGDRETVELVMLWVQEAMRPADQGIPTGAPLSPLLGNLLLDRFDELIAARGARLVRYGDDFLILCRTKEMAEKLFQTAHEEARQLQLSLNETPFEVIDFDEPFRFLGFEFLRHDRWETHGIGAPRRLEELGWHDASIPPRPKAKKILLAGETGEPARDFGFTAIVGPEATNLELRSDSLGCHYSGGRTIRSIPLADLETLVVLGNIGLSASVLEKLTARQVHLVLADDRGDAFASILGDQEVPHDVLQAQVAAQASGPHCLEIARALIVSKIHNYLRLAESLESGEQGVTAGAGKKSADRGGVELSGKLRRLVSRAQTSTRIEELRGVEGAAAAAWYGSFGTHLGKGFSFPGRVAPAAEDPVNVLLNIAQTHLYRLMILAIKSAGLCSSLGFLHAPTGRFAALASDLQESFRFLMDRVVIEATWELKPTDFVRDDRGTYPLTIKRHAARSFQQMLWRSLHLDCRLRADQEESTSYLVLIQRQARQLRRHLLHPELPFEGMRLP